MLEPTTLATAALVTQLFILLIIAGGISMLKETPAYRHSDSAPNFWAIFGLLALISFGPLILSDELVQMSQGLFGGFNLAFFSLATSKSIMFTVNMVALALFIDNTGGARASPFTSQLVLLPVLAIFLREPYNHVSAYVGVVAIVLGYTSISPSTIGPRRYEPNSACYLLVTISTLLLGTMVSYVTRPIP